MIKVLSGAAGGREMPLVKLVTTMGKPGVVVAAVARTDTGYELRRVEGDGLLTLNGRDVQGAAIALSHEDEINLVGTTMQFLKT